MDGAGTEEEERAPRGLECKDEQEDTYLHTGHSGGDAAAVSGHSAGSRVLQSALQSTYIKQEVVDTLVTEDRISSVKKVEEDGSCCTWQATGSTFQDSAASDSQFPLASACGQMSDSPSDTKAVPPLSVDQLAQDPPGQSGLCEQCECCYSDGIDKKEEKESTSSSGMCTETAFSGIPGVLCRPGVCGPASRRPSKGASANAAAQQSHKMSSVLGSRSGRPSDGTKGKKELLWNPEILPPVRKKSRTFYSAEQLEELEKMFQEDHYPDNEKRREIAAVVGVTPQRIMVWFQNRRAKWRKLEKLSVKDNKKCPTSSTLAPLLLVPSLPDVAATLDVDTAAGSYSSQSSGCPAPLATSSSASSVAGMVASCQAVETKALAQPSCSSSRMESFPSPPPIRRASLPPRLPFTPHCHIDPLMLDSPNSAYSLSTQEKGSREAFAYTIQNQSLSSPVPCNYPEELESTGNLETMYCQYSSQSGVYQLPQYTQQHQLSYFPHLPGHLAGSVLSGAHLSPRTLAESHHTAFLTLPVNTGVVNYGAAAATQGYVQNHVGEHLLLQQPSGNSAGITAHQAVPWNDVYMQGAPFSNQLHSRVHFSSTAGGQYFTEQLSYTCLPFSPYFLQVSNGTALESMPHTGKQQGVTLAEQSSYQKHQTEPELALLAEGEEVESVSKKEEAVIDSKEETSD